MHVKIIYKIACWQRRPKIQSLHNTPRNSAVEGAGRTLKLLFAESNPQMNLEAQALWAENKRLKAECEKAQRSKAKLGSQLHAISQSARDEEDELVASAAVAQEFAAAQKRLEVELLRARDEKRLMEQALVRLPLEAQRRHEEEADRLRAELEASRRPGADKVPEHRRKKVRSLGELMDWHARMSSSAGASLQGIGAHNGKERQRLGNFVSQHLEAKILLRHLLPSEFPRRRCLPVRVEVVW